MNHSYQHLSLEDLQSLYETHCQNLAHLERQAAAHGGFSKPLLLINEIEYEQTAINSINAEIQQRNTILARIKKPLCYRHRPDADINSPEVDYNLLYIANILDSSLSDLELILGTPSEIIPYGIGTSEALPQGGETRSYQFQGLSVDVNFNKQGIAQGTRIEGLAKETLSINDWHTILHRLGISMRKPHDREALTALWWSNYQGYAITVATNKVGGYIDIVRVYKVDP